MPDVVFPQIGPHMLQFRKRRKLTLDGLAKLSGVSRSRLSQIERGQANPTVAIVWALAEALKVDISELIGVQKARKGTRIDIASRSFTPEIKTDDGLCVLRILSPAERVGSLEWYELLFSPGAALVSAPHTRGTQEHLTLLDGELVVVAGEESNVIKAGATARYPADMDHTIRNDSKHKARALLVVIT
jgi:transcriptional regulator with XRE-family HTH domain